MTSRGHLRLGSAVAAGVSGLLLVTACGTGDNGAGGSGDGQTKIAAVIKGLDNPFFQAMEDGIQAQADAQGVSATVQAAANITDTTGQAERLTAMAQQDFDCFVVNPISGTNLVQGLAQVARTDKPVVNIDSPVDADAAKQAGVDLATYIGTDNTAAGRLGGEEMLRRVDAGGKVALIGGIAGDVTSGARLDGFTAAVQGKLTVLPTVAADWERQKALTAATDIMRANPDLAGFFVANDDMGLGVARAVANAGKTGQIAVISVDGNQDALNAVSSGELTATIAQYPYAIGEMGLQACVAAADGTELPKQIQAPVALVTSDNAADALAAFPAPFQPFDNPLDSLGK